MLENQGAQDNQTIQEKMVSVVLEEVEDDYDGDRWHVVDQSAGQAVIGTGAAKSLPIGVQYRLALRGDFGEDDMILVYGKGYKDYKNYKGEKEYFLYRVQNGQLVQATQKKPSTPFGDWMFRPDTGFIQRTRELFQIAPGQFGYWEALRENWGWPQVIKEAAFVVADILGDDSVDSITDRCEDDLVGCGVFQILDQLIKMRQRAEIAEETANTVGEIAGSILSSDFEESNLAPLIKGHGYGGAKPLALRLRTQIRSIFDACQGIQPDLRLSDRHL